MVRAAILKGSLCDDHVCVAVVAQLLKGVGQAVQQEGF